jgi:hypothetical protein
VAAARTASYDAAPDGQQVGWACRNACCVSRVVAELLTLNGLQHLALACGFAPYRSGNTESGWGVAPFLGFALAGKKRVID